MAQQTTVQTPTVKLNNGIDFPVVGLGTGGITNPETFTDFVRATFDAGYRHLDTAIMYQNHKQIGVALKQIFSEGKYKREDIFITTKVYPTNDVNGLEALKQALTDLQVTYVDLYLVHFPAAFAPVESADKDLTVISKPQHLIWAELEDAYAQKLTRSIGVSNYNVQSLANLLSYAKVRPAVNQVELHVYLQQPDLLAFHKRVGIVVTAYAPLARAGNDAKGFFDVNQFNVFEDPLLKGIAQKHGRTPAQVALNFIWFGLGAVVIPKTENKARLAENLDWLNFTLTKEEIEQLRGLDKNKRVWDFRNGGVFGFVNYFA